jgi:methylated-DNA-protein-cysteine methyltransferase-like protein
MTRRARAAPGGTFSSFARRVYALVRRIPRGRVMTYGAIAELIPGPTGIPPRSYRRVRARWVGYALARCPDSIPWQRVVNAQGRVSPRLGHGPLIQRELLRREGVRFLPGDRISLGRFAWNPTSSRRRRA